MKTNLFSVCITAVMLLCTSTFAQTLVTNMSSTNGDVYSVYKDGGSYYLGGSFTYVGLNTGYAAATKTNNDFPNMNFPSVNGNVETIVPDGTGGWYIGGFFSVVGTTAASNLAHINANNTVDAAFNAACNSRVRTIARVATRLYIGGDFTTVNGTSRLYAAAVNANTGAVVLAWNPAPNYSVYSIAPVFGTDTTLWLGGSFSAINSTVNRPYLAKVNSSNGNTISGSVSANSTVYKLLARGDSVFVGGSYTRLGLRTDYLGSITTGSGNADQSMPVANGQIRSISPDGTGGWYVAGFFTQIGGVSRSYVARLNPDKTVNVSFNVTSNSYVYSLALDGN
ncbi:MAG: delta-60 repeat domain-containing protein, partial [Panacibacter sp.]